MKHDQPMELKDWTKPVMVKAANEREAAARAATGPHASGWDKWTPRICFGGPIVLMAVLVVLYVREMWK